MDISPKKNGFNLSGFQPKESYPFYKGNISSIYKLLSVPTWISGFASLVGSVQISGIDKVRRAPVYFTYFLCLLIPFGRPYGSAMLHMISHTIDSAQHQHGGWHTGTLPQNQLLYVLIVFQVWTTCFYPSTHKIKMFLPL